MVMAAWPPCGTSGAGFKVDEDNTNDITFTNAGYTVLRTVIIPVKAGDRLEIRASILAAIGGGADALSYRLKLNGAVLRETITEGFSALWSPAELAFVANAILPGNATVTLEGTSLAGGTTGAIGPATPPSDAVLTVANHGQP